jgi:hypothetical protein
MAKFIEGYCNQQMPPPYEFRDVRIWDFPIQADADAVAAIVNKFLPAKSIRKSTGASFQILRGIGPFSSRTMVYMMVLDYGSMSCVGTTDYMAQKEFYFAIPLLRSKEGQLPDIVLFTPYIFVDNSWSMTCGNMVLGYPKQLAWFLMSGEDGDPYPIRITTPVFAREGACVQTWQSCAMIRDTGLMQIVKQAGQQLWPFGDIDLLFGMNGLLPLAEETFELFDQLVNASDLSYDLVQLKQIRNAQKPAEASYQALVTSTVHLQKYHFGSLLPPAAVSLPVYYSLALSRDLGIPESGTVLLPFWLRCSFEISDLIEQPLQG